MTEGATRQAPGGATSMLYRPYIDGLRAIAVAAVIYFHFRRPAASGGFIGVDIFFVISGFLITQLLSESCALPASAQLARFYLRRIRRILPALVATSLVVAVAGLFIYLPDDLPRLGRYLVFAALMLSNFANWQDGGYFGPGANYYTPLTHFWSLAVEEQFYIAYPVAFLFLVRAHPKWLMAGLTLIGGASMAFCIAEGSRHAGALFYLMPARAWELMLGAIAARYPATRLGGRLAAEGAGALCLAAVFIAFYALTEATGFPHPYVAIPCCATALLLFISRGHTTVATRLLSIRPLVFTGRISYSLYLWHIPVLVFAQYLAVRQLALGELAPLAVLIYGVAVLSWRFLENPIRRKVLLRSDRALLGAAAAGCMAVGVLGAWFWQGDGFPWRFSPAIQLLTRIAPVRKEAVPCFMLPLGRIASGDLCRFGPQTAAAPKVVLWGDSHSHMLFPAIEALAKSRGVQLNYAAHSSCRPLLDATASAAGPQGRESCASFNIAMLSALRHIHPDMTILSGFWDPDGAPRHDWKPTLQSTITAIRATGSPVCIVLDVPEQPYVEPYALAMARRRNLDPGFLYLKRAEVAARHAEFETAVRALESSNELRVVDPKDVLCSGTHCEVELAGRTLYRDSNHLTEVGAMRVADAIRPCLEKLR